MSTINVFWIIVIAMLVAVGVGLKKYDIRHSEVVERYDDWVSVVVGGVFSLFFMGVVIKKHADAMVGLMDNNIIAPGDSSLWSVAFMLLLVALAGVGLFSMMFTVSHFAGLYSKRAQKAKLR